MEGRQTVWDQANTEQLVHVRTYSFSKAVILLTSALLVDAFTQKATMEKAVP